MDFITWWFDTHAFWSTILSPSMTFIYCIYAGAVWRGITCIVYLILLAIIKVAVKS